MKSLTLFTVLALGPGVLVAATDDSNDLNCTCYKTNGSSSGYFLYHEFLDYRNVNTTANQYSSAPTILTDADNTTNAPVTSDYFNSDQFTNFWNTQTWNNSADIGTDDGDGGDTLRIYTQNNVYILDNNDTTGSYNTSLFLRTSRLEDFQSAAEIDSVEDGYNYLSVRFLGRVYGATGACAAVFTYRETGEDQEQDVEEADTEILTKDPKNKVQYTNQPSVSTNGNTIANSTVNSTNPDNVDWTEWNIYRMDWMPKVTSWYVNGQSTANISIHVPTGAAYLIMNIWSDGSNWSGNMSVGGNAYMEVQWLELVYNLTDASSKKRGLDRRDEKCDVVCSVDNGVKEVGTPVLNGATQVLTQGVMIWLSFVWFIIFCTGML